LEGLVDFHPPWNVELKHTAPRLRFGKSAIRTDLLISMIAPPVAPLDRRQSPTALAVSRGTQRLLMTLGLSCIAELPLKSARRADLVALGGDGEIWIVEIKSSVEDFRADQKWAHYRMHCDRLFFATAAHVPLDIFPADAGLILADTYGADLVREAPQHRLHAATRKRVTLAFARAAAARLQMLCDPQGPHGSDIIRP
jgi:hypothetical protein